MITLKHSLATNSTSTISLLQNKHTNVFSPTTNKKQQKLKINQKLVTHPNLANLLMRVNPADLFYSTGLELHWAELYLTPHNPLSSVTLTSAISCHDSISKNNIIYTAIGTFTGQIYLIGGIIIPFIKNARNVGVSCIKWTPTLDCFIAGFEDGTVILFDADKEEALFNPLIPTSELQFVNAKCATKTNPVQWWKCGIKTISGFSFSSDFTHVAVASLDGHLRIVNYSTSTLVSIYQSYFAGLLSVCWSPDGRYILTGGQDDFVTVYEFMGKIIARCRGHSSWVLAVAFDNNIDSDRMRFASVGEDTNLCLWDLVLSGLNPRTRLTLSRSLVGVNSTVENGFSGRNVVPVIGPILITKISDNPVCMVNFTEEGIVTADRQGLVKVWMRSATLENKK